MKSTVQIEKRAPKGTFRVIGVNTADPHEWLHGDRPTLRQAKLLADSSVKTRHAIQMHVYDDKGAHRHNALGWRDDFHVEALRTGLGVDLALRVQNQGVDPRY